MSDPRLCITLTAEENQMVTELERMTSQKPPAILKLALALLHKKELAAHVAKQNARRALQLEAGNKKANTPEERCVAKGGEVVEIDGVMKCAVVNGALTRYELLS